MNFFFITEDIAGCDKFVGVLEKQKLLYNTEKLGNRVMKNRLIEI